MTVFSDSYNPAAGKTTDESTADRHWLAATEKKLAATADGKRLIARAHKLMQECRGRGVFVRWIDMLREVLADDASGAAVREAKLSDRASALCAAALGRNEYLSFSQARLIVASEK